MTTADRNPAQSLPEARWTPKITGRGFVNGGFAEILIDGKPYLPRLIAAAPTMAEFIQRVAVHFDGTDAPLGIEARAILTQIRGVPHAE